MDFVGVEFELLDLFDDSFNNSNDTTNQFVRITPHQARLLTMLPGKHNIDFFDLFRYTVCKYHNDRFYCIEDYLNVPKEILYEALKAHPELGPERWDILNN